MVNLFLSFGISAILRKRQSSKYPIDLIFEADWQLVNLQSPPYPANNPAA